MSQETTNNRRAVEKLTAGDHITDAQGVHEVVHALEFSNGDGSPMTALTLRPLANGQPWIVRWQHGTTLHLATDDEVREYKDLGRRQALAKALHQLATDIVERRLPIPQYRFEVGGVLPTRADLEAWAEFLGVDVAMGGGGDIPVVRHEAATGDGPALCFGMQSRVEPKPAPEPEGLDSLSDQAAGMAAADEAGVLTAPEPEHYHVAGTAGGPGENSAECACGLVFDGFDTHAGAMEFLSRHIANPEPTEAEQEWLFTFGEGQTYAGRFVRLFGTREAAEARMKRVFGHAWAEQYDWRTFDQAGLLAKLTELPEAEWPAHPDGEPAPELSPKTLALVEQVQAAMPGQKTDEFERLGEGLCYVSVCTSLSDEDAAARVNEVPAGTSNGWTLSEDKEFADGTPHPTPCPDKPATHRHLLFEA